MLTSRAISTPSFNWATGFDPWKRRSIQKNCHREQIASIGPRAFTRGYQFVGYGEYLLRGRASIGPRIFTRGYECSTCRVGHGCPGASIGPRIFTRGYRLLLAGPPGFWRGFNWATDFHPWILHLQTPNRDYIKWLQLGHGFSPVDTVVSDLKVFVGNHASIGPRIFTRGYSTLQIALSQAISLRCFREVRPSLSRCNES
jgi:hypothetical protein